MYPNWLQSGIVEPSILTHKFLKIGFSQDGEDDYIRSFFWERLLRGYEGIYIDIGCYNESLYSNTKLLSLFGWKGIAVDANPLMKDDWLRNRPSDKFFNLAIKPSGDDTTSINLHRFQDGALNTIDKEVAKDLQQKRNTLLDIITVEAISLSDLADRFLGVKITNPNFVNIDIEFVDYLDDLNIFLSRLKRPELICLELVTDRKVTLDNFNKTREYKILGDNNYKIINIIGNNIFAVPDPSEEKIVF